MQYRTFLDIQEAAAAEEADIAIVGVPNENASFRPGARLAPTVIRLAALSLDRRCYVSDAAQTRIVDVGNCWNTPGYGKKSAAEITEQLNRMLADGTRHLMLGGDGANSYIAVRRLAKQFGPLALVHFGGASSQRLGDSDGELYEEPSIFSRLAREEAVDAAASIHVGLREWCENNLNAPRNDGFAFVTAREIAHAPNRVANMIVERVGSVAVYLSFDVNALDPAFAPGSVEPICGGISMIDCLSMLRSIPSLRIVGADVVGFSPLFDSAEVTALGTATIAAEILRLLAAWEGNA